jgi:hypothetical protein
MTSPSHAVHRPGRRHTDLVRALTWLKEDSGLTFDELAARTTVSASALKRAAGLHAAVAPEHVVTAFVRACGAGADQEPVVLKLWRAARAEQRGILATLHAPAVTAIRTGADLTAALAAAYERAGAPALRVLQERATTDDTDGALLLPRTSAWRITRREGRPTTWTQCAAFLRGCGIHPRRMPAWHDAWTRTQNPTPAARRPNAPLGPLLLTERVHLATSTTSKRTYLAPPTGAATDGNWTAPLPRADRACLPGEERALTRFFDGLAPAERHTVLAAGLTRLLTTRARRNGTAPDTAVDAITVSDDGTLHVIQAKHYGDTAPPAPALLAQAA